MSAINLQKKPRVRPPTKKEIKRTEVVLQLLALRGIKLSLIPKMWRIKNQTLRKIILVFDYLKAKRITFDENFTFPQLVQLIQEVLACNKTTAYDYAHAVLYITT